MREAKEIKDRTHSLLFIPTRPKTSRPAVLRRLLHLARERSLQFSGIVVLGVDLSIFVSMLAGSFGLMLWASGGADGCLPTWILAQLVGGLFYQVTFFTSTGVVNIFLRRCELAASKSRRHMLQNAVIEQQSKLTSLSPLWLWLWLLYLYRSDADPSGEVPRGSPEEVARSCKVSQDLTTSPSVRRC